MRGFKVHVQLATYSVKIATKKDKYFDPAVNQGLCEPNVKRIYIAANLTDDCKFTTYMHELMHAIFFELGEDKLAYNEPFVETISQVLARAVREMPKAFK